MQQVSIISVFDLTGPVIEPLTFRTRGERSTLRSLSRLVSRTTDNIYKTTDSCGLCDMPLNLTLGNHWRV